MNILELVLAYIIKKSEKSDEEIKKLHEDKVAKLGYANPDDSEEQPKTVGEFREKYPNMIELGNNDGDDWTLGSGDVVATETVDISIEEVNESLETNVKTAGNARKQYADTVKNIVEDPENWHSRSIGVEKVEREYEKMPKTTFEDIIDVVLSHEGGFVNDPDDRGGATNLGVTQATLSQFRENDVTQEDVENLTVEEAKECYLEMFWKPSMAGKLPDEVRHLYFDMVVNHGQGNAVKILQMACKGQGDDIDVDGAIGPSTIKAASDITEWELLVERTGFYWNLVFDGSRYQKRNSQAKFIRGWLRRAFSFLED